MTGKPPEPIDDSICGTDDPSPPTLGELRRTDELLDALSERRAAGCDGAGDPALALLKAFADDVDDGAPPLVHPAADGRTGRGRRRLPRTMVSLCVATTVLMTTGVAAAGGGLTSLTPVPGRSAPELRSWPGRPEAQDVVSKERYVSVPLPLKRRAAVPHDAGPAGKADHDQLDGPQSPQPTPSPKTGPYGLYITPGVPPEPTPEPSGSPGPAPAPSVTPQQQPGPQSPAVVQPSSAP